MAYTGKGAFGGFETAKEQSDYWNSFTKKPTKTTKIKTTPNSSIGVINQLTGGTGNTIANQLASLNVPKANTTSNKNSANNLFLNQPSTTEKKEIPTYDFLKTPSQNASQGNNLGFSGSVAPQQPIQQPNINNQINELLTALSSKVNQGYQFDPNDPVLNQMQDQAIGKVRQDMARRGRVFDTYAATKEQLAAQQMIPDYYNMARTGYDRDINNLASALGQYRNVQQDNRAMEQNMIANEVTNYGVELSPRMRQYEQQYQQIPQQEIARLMPYSQNFAGRIKELRAIDPNHPDIPILETLRAMKVLSDPQLLQQYGAEYGMQSTAINQMAEANTQQELLNKLEVLKQQMANEKYAMEISKIQADISKIESEAQYKNAQIVAEEYKALQEQIKTSTLPAQIKAEIEADIALASQRYASAELSTERINTERLQQDKIINDINKAQNLTGNQKYVAHLFLDYINSGMDINAYLQSPVTETVNGKEEPVVDNNGNTFRKVDDLSNEEMKMLLDLVKQQKSLQDGGDFIETLNKLSKLTE